MISNVISVKSHHNQDALPVLLETPDAATLEEIGRLRIIAWEYDGERPSIAAGCGDVWLDEHDSHAHHWVIKKNGVLLAAARLCVHNSKDALPDAASLSDFLHKILFPAAFFNRLVVHPSARGKGLASKIDDERLRFAAKQGAKLALIHTHNPLRLKQLQASGWSILGETSKRFVSRFPDYILVKSLLP